MKGSAFKNRGGGTAMQAGGESFSSDNKGETKASPIKKTLRGK